MSEILYICEPITHLAYFFAICTLIVLVIYIILRFLDH